MKTVMKFARQVMRWVCIGKPSQLWKRYVLGFLIIFATIATSHWASFQTISAAEKDAEVLTLSNRQRMLSQRILFLMSEYRQNGDEQVSERLEAALNLFETSHEWLITQADLSPALRELYFEQQPISLDAFSRRFVQMAGIAQYANGPDAEELNKLLAKWGTEDLMAALAKAAYMFKTESEARVADLQMVHHMSMFAALAVLFLEAVFIFFPAQVTVNTAIRRLEMRKQLLKKSLSTLRARNRDLLSARQHLTFAANHDQLTGLMNRRAIYERMREGESTELGGDTLRCIMKIDLDRFKETNDSLGHAAGDAVLKRVAQILDDETEARDAVGRMGGDEFVIVLSNPSSLEELDRLALRIIGRISEPIDFENSKCRVGASIGYTIDSCPSATPDQLLIEADLALYEAKRAGRGTVRGYSKAMAAEIETRRVLFQQITKALSAEQFVPYFQPQLVAATGELYGCEVLARWQHPQSGIVPPGTFIAAAEESGLIDQIDRMIIQKGLDAIEALDAMGLHLPRVSFNASPPTLRDPFLAERLLQDIRERHLEPRRLTIEVLESTLIESEDDVALRTVTELTEAGFSVVLDDFGTGYASMSNLSFLDLNGLKLDQSLVKPVHDPRAESIVSALVMLSHDLGMNVVAEGVETAGHIETVHRLGCDVVQGFGISRPLPFDGFVAWLTEYNEKGQPWSRAG